jgi:hypothetical protein
MAEGLTTFAWVSGGGVCIEGFFEAQLMPKNKIITNEIILSS